jgi:hypothetical protein
MYGMSSGKKKKKKMQDGGKTKLAGMYGDPNKITRGDIITAAKKNKKQMGGMMSSPTMGVQRSKVMNTQAPNTFIENNKQKTMMYGGMAAKKEKKMMYGGKVHGRGYNRSYEPRKPQSV